MDSVFQKLEDIEMTAEAIVEHAEEETGRRYEAEAGSDQTGI